MMEDDWFLPDVGGQPLQKFFECHMEEAKRCTQQPSNGPQKNGYYAPDFPEKIAKNCLPLSLLWSSVMLGKCTMQVFTFFGGFAVLQISTSSLLCAGDLGRHGMLHATEIAPHILKPSSKKQMAFKYVVVAVPF